jgi:hypothetical protein
MFVSELHLGGAEARAAELVVDVLETAIDRRPHLAHVTA